MAQKDKYEICLRLTKEEKNILANNAKQCGLSKTAYLRRLILGTPIKECPVKELRDLYTEINHIGNNINQIARSVNAGIATPEDARRGLFMLEQVQKLVYALANR